MRKLLVAVCVLASLATFAVAQNAQQVEDFEDYKAIRGDAKVAFEKGEFEKAAKLFEKAARSKHADKLPYVKAWQLNSAAFALIKADKNLARALELLLEAKDISEIKAECLELVEKNIAYCEEHLK